jgi:hypothetical protein
MADATFTDVQYQLKRVYRNRGYIANLSYKSDAFMGLLNKRAAKNKTGGQADMVPVQFSGAGGPSNTSGTIGTASATQGVQFAVTPVPMTNLMGLDVLAALSGSDNIGAIVKPLKREMDGTLMKVGKVASIELWSNGFPAIGQVTVDGSTTITMQDPDDIIKFEVNDTIVFAAAQSTGALRAITTGQLTVVKILTIGATGTWQANAAGNSEAVTNDFAFLKNTRNTAATKVGITGVAGWLPATADTLFGVDRTIDARLIGMQMTGSLADIEGAFIDGVAQVLTYSANGTDDLTAFMHPKMWAILAKAMQARTVSVLTAKPIQKKGREGTVSYSGFQVMTPSGTIEVFTPQFCTKNKIFMFNMTTWELVGWGMAFPGLIAPMAGAAPDIFMDPSTGLIRAAVGGFPQLECNAPGFNLVITLS